MAMLEHAAGDDGENGHEQHERGERIDHGKARTALDHAVYFDR